MSCQFEIVSGMKCNQETDFRFCSNHEKRSCSLCPFPAIKNCLECGSIICQECLCCNNQAKKKGNAFREYGLFSTGKLPETHSFMVDMAIGRVQNGQPQGIPEREVIEFAGFNDALGYGRTMLNHFVGRDNE